MKKNYWIKAIIWIIILIIKKNISFFNNNIIYKTAKKRLSDDKYYPLQYLYNYYNESFYFKFEIKFFYLNKINIIQIKFLVSIYDKYQNLIIPSDLALYKDIHILCYIKLQNINIDIFSIPNIYLNNYYECIEFLNLHENIKLGIKIYKNNDKNYENKTVIFFSKNINIYNNNKILFIKDDNCENMNLIKDYIKYINEINIKNDYKNKNNKLKKLYIQFPVNTLKRFMAIEENKWYFKNIYNHYFCFCKGFYCIENKSFEKCKYFSYLYIIDKNKNIYKKQNYLFIDFIFPQYSSVDVYPVFQKMAINKYPVHYLTANKELYNQYCYNIDKCLIIIYVNKNNYTVNGNFLEKHLTLILKLKQVISAAGVYFNYINNFFYNIDYIIYICAGHGVSYLKHFLYETYNWYGNKVFDKILIPPSYKLILVVKRYGWDDEDIIKINLPRWDNYNNDIATILDDKYNFGNYSIFVMFTWRRFKKNKNISNNYFKNILNLINNELLNNALKSNKINLYFSLHHKLNKYKTLFKNSKYINFLEEIKISKCLSLINLLISDFSSIIFDIMYRRKPFILYIPDANDPDIENIYDKNYCELINSLKNRTLFFQNIFFQLNEVIQKIIYYIQINFDLDNDLKQFYDSFEIKKGNNTEEFINYITNIT